MINNGYDKAAREVDEFPVDGHGHNVRLLQCRSLREILASHEPLEWLVDGIIEKGVLAEIFGPPKSVKSLWAQDLMASIALGSDFHGKAVKQGLVVYLCGEGQRGLQRRFRAWELHHNTNLSDAPIEVVTEVASMIQEEGVEALRLTLKEIESRYEGSIQFVVIDTLARWMAPGDENRTQEMGMFLAGVDMAIPEGVTRLIVHHTGWGSQDRNRGSSSLQGAIDQEFISEGMPPGSTDACVKGGLCKEGEPIPPQYYQLTEVETDLKDSNGKPMKSVVLVDCEAPPDKSKEKALGDKQTAILDSLKEIQEEARKRADEQGAPYPEVNFSISDLRDRVRKTDAELAGHKQWGRVINSLHQRHLIRLNDNKTTVSLSRY